MSALLSCRVKLSVLAVLSCFTGYAQALPNGAEVVHGSASLQQNGNLLTITNSSGAAINWQGFSIGANETVRFVQPSSTSNVLNRVVGSDPSTLLGLLQSNGRVWLINPAGILVGPGARIDVAGFVASTLPVRTEDFLAGKLLFQGAGGAVQNQGTITTPSGGHIYLIGGTVENSGTLQAPGGNVALAGGDKVQIGDTATPGVVLEVGSGGSVSNTGQIVADAGRVGLVGALVKNSGLIDASSVEQQGGRVYLRAGDQLEQSDGGKINVSGTSGGSASLEAGDKALVGGSIEAQGKAGDGGNVQVLADKVALLDNASVNASGANNGGTVLLGGDWQGGNPAIRNANFAYFGSGARITANAGQHGNGGKVVVWSNDTTRAYGSVSARGGALSGDGGKVEISGKQTLVFQALADTSAPFGATGMVLLDPSDVTIRQSQTPLPSNPNTVGGDSYFAGGTGNTTLNWADINKLLETNNVFITTDGSGASRGGTILLAPGNNNYTSPHSLNLYAHSDIEATGFDLFNHGSGAINFTAGWNGGWQGSPGGSRPVNEVNVGVGSIDIEGSEIVTGGNMDWRAGGDIEILGGGSAEVDSLSGSGSNRDARVRAGGTLRVTAPIILIMGGDNGNNNFASLTSDGSQVINTKQLAILGGGDSGAFSSNFAELAIWGGNSVQTVNIAEGGNILVKAGSGTGLTEFRDKNGTLLCNACTSSNWAQLRAAGAQDINVSTGNIVVFGGKAGAGNHAEITAAQGQSISGQANILAFGGTGGSNSSFSSSDGTRALLWNQAGIFNVEGRQAISAANITLEGLGDANTVGGAFIGALQQQINVSGSVRVHGGDSNALGPDRLPGAGPEHGPGAGAGIVSEDMVMNIGGDLALLGGSGSRSPAILGNPFSGKALVRVAGKIIRSGTVLTTPSLTVVQPEVTSRLINSELGRFAKIAIAKHQLRGAAAERSLSVAEAKGKASGNGSEPGTQASKPAGPANMRALTAMITQRHEQRTELYQEALTQLRRDPTVADEPDCAGAPGANELCVRTDTQAKLTYSAVSSVPPTRKRMALLIANNAYTDKRVGRLNTPTADVEAVAQQLRDKFNFETRIVTNASKAEFFREMNKLAGEVEQADSVFVMYAGHGYLMNDTKMGFWLPVDAKADSAQSWISNNDISRFLKAIPARQVMLVSDSCFSGSLTREQAIREARTVERTKILRQRSVTALSSGGDEPVLDSGAGGHSVFTGHLLNSLGRLKKDVTGFELYRGLHSAVLQEFPQAPQYGGVLSAGHVGEGDYLIDVQKP